MPPIHSTPAPLPLIHSLPERVARFIAARQPGLGLASLSFLLTLLWVAAVKPMDAPDEPSHMEAVMQVRNQHKLPEVHFDPHSDNAVIVGDAGDQSIRDYAVSVGIVNQPFWIMPYEATQPPLFYVVAGLVTALAPPAPQTALYLSRLVAALFGAGTVYFCWAAARQFAPRAPRWAIAAAGMVALLPQFCFNSATASNDSTANCLSAAALYVMVRGLQQPDYDPRLVRASAVIALAVLAKLTAAALIPGLALVWLFRIFQARPAAWPARLGRGAGMIAGAAATGLLICGPWLVRNLIVYGEPSGTADAFRIYRAGSNRVDFAAPHGGDEFFRSTWESIWGRFSWMSISLPGELYQQAIWVALTLLTLSGITCIGVAAVSLWRRKWGNTAAWQAAAVMVVIAGALAYAYVQYNTTVAFQAQGRYLFLLLLPAGLLVTGGLHALAPGRLLKTAVLSLPLLWLAYLNSVGLAILYGVH